MALTEEQKAFRKNPRILLASQNAPPMRRGEMDSIAVKLLQNALMRHGMTIPAGATGTYFDQTIAAVIAFERAHSLMVDSGNAGREVIGKLISLDGEDTVTLPPRKAHMTVQTCKGAHPMPIGQMIAVAAAKLIAFNVTLAPLIIPGQVDYDDPVNTGSPDEVRACLEAAGNPKIVGNQIIKPIFRRNTYRVIITRFPFAGYFGSTPDDPDNSQHRITFLNSLEYRTDNGTLLHEMIHAAGRGTPKNPEHDEDPTSHSAASNRRSVLKPDDAALISKAFFTTAG